MSIRIRSAIVFPLALLSVLALLTFWINKTVQPPAPRLDGSSRHDPDYIMSNFVTTQTDINGGLRYKLAAAEMKHFPDDDTTDLQRPRYTQFSVGKPYTQVEGLRGHVSGNGEEVELFDNVKITRQAFAGKGEMTVETDYLKILPNEELVRTESPVVIRQAPKTVIYATGMLYEKKKRTVTLQHKVRAHYERPGIQTTGIKAAVTEATSKAAPVDSKALGNSATTSHNHAATIKQSADSKSDKSNTKKSNPNDARIRRHYE